MSDELLKEYVSLFVEKIRSKKGQKSPWGDKFDFKKFKSIEQINIMKEYAKMFLSRLGEGSSRVAYLMSSKYALKIAVNDKGLAQNQAEVEVYTNPESKKIVAKIYDSDDKFKWVISDLVKPITTPQEFQSLTSVSWDDFKEYMAHYLKHKYDVKDCSSPFIKSVVITAQQNNLLRGDLTEIDHWGKTPDGRCVLLDYGFTGEVQKSHYSDKPKMTGKTAGSQEKTNKPGSVKTDVDPEKTGH